MSGETGETGKTGAINEAIRQFPRKRARTLRFSGAAPRSAKLLGDGERALFLRSDGQEDLVTSLWLSWFDAAGVHHETKLADPRELLADADNEDVPAEEKARRERAREGGAGIVSYSVDVAGRRVVFTINGQLFLTEIVDEEDADEPTARTRQLGADASGASELGVDEYGPVLNPRISPDGRRVLYTTGAHLVLVEIGDWPAEDAAQADALESLESLESFEQAEEPAGDAHDGVFVEVSADEAALSEGLYAEDAGEIEGTEESEGAAEAPAPVDTFGIICSADEEDDEAENTWKIGLAEFVAGEEMNRYDGFWWGPDSRHILFETFDTQYEPMWYISDPTHPDQPAAGRRYPRALTHNADVCLTIGELEFDGDGSCTGFTTAEVQWDADAYEYVAAVSWPKDRDPIVLVQDRCQRNDQVLSVNADLDADEAGETTVLETHHNDQWIDIVLGTPAMTPSGHLVCALNDMEADTNRLTVDGEPFTPAGWNVRQVLDVTDDDVLAIVQREPDLTGPIDATQPDERNAGGWIDPDDHDARCFDVVSIGYDGTVSPATPLVAKPGVWHVSRAAKGMIVSGRGMDDAKGHMIHVRLNQPGFPDASEITKAEIANDAATPGFTPNTTFVRLGEHRLYTAITRPSESSEAAKRIREANGGKLPVLLKPYGGPGFQQVVLQQAYYWESQWWADQGFIVVTADGRGTTGRGPKWDREIFENMKDVTLADQVEAVRALADVPEAVDADLDKVCMIGWSYGGFLSALAVLDAPDVVKAGCAGAPPTDWTLYDTHYTERYLGLDPAVYERNGIVQDAPKLTRPLMLIHGFADDNVTIAHSLKLSQALMAAGRPHTYLPLTGITHMTNDETVAENLLTLQRDFLYEAFGLK
ncbi:prolyl oligopeptidase family serine peptidase [Bifidobacterium vespertilionis]|uniref:S9 family peptidase n=1 Tax=Bifidobacterium vespertilionis TaxID=2562524 RepID=A0A5J5DXC7_9BIFI|nr:prolyl oligopeptidase family serine peptidase [Bifidobacterium vespertilionis]KAA8821119.1 S9 family peptidase [Bifidobacterium vespertilionis]KAA8823649.1 S9 family peptidase [Bifidobacterium vespertilionis]